MSGVVASLLRATSLGCGGEAPTAPAPAPLAVSEMQPREGSVRGGTMVSIRGSGFRAGMTVTLGGIAATSVVVLSSASLVAFAPPAAAAGAVDVAVTAPGGGRVALPWRFQYLPGCEDADGCLGPWDY
jgi:hypothetical protein